MGITLNDVKNSVVEAITGFKSDDTLIYEEKVEQGFTYPCFFIEMTNFSQEQQLGHRYRRTHTFKVSYFAKEENGKIEDRINTVEDLYEHLSYISIGDTLLRGTHLKHEMKERVLQFSVDYIFDVFKTRAQEMPMENFYMEGDVKSEEEKNS
jgi:hypothetical protein